MFSRAWSALGYLVRATVAVAIVSSTTWFITLVRDDWVGVTAGFCAGLFFAVSFVYIDWPTAGGP